MKITELQNHQIAADKQQVPMVGENGEPQIVDLWRLVFIDQNTGDVTFLTFSDVVRDTIVRQLTGGIVLAGGKLPKMDIPQGK